MSARRERERLTGALAMLIDSKHRPPEPAALELARTVVLLVEGRLSAMQGRTAARCFQYVHRAGGVDPSPGRQSQLLPVRGDGGC